MVAMLKLVQNEKSCDKCGEVKPIAEFQHNVGHGKTRPTGNCKACRSEQKSKTWADKRANGTASMPNSKVILTEDGRVCVTCDQPKAWNKFHKDIHGYNQKTATCSDCRNVKGRKVYQENPAVRRSGNKNRPDKLMKFYGITFADVVRAYDEQHGRCANHACGTEITLETKSENRGMKNKAMIDHNHDTGKFRALLCMQCNFTLGYLEKQENIILGLQDYLTKHNNKGE